MEGKKKEEKLQNSKKNLRKRDIKLFRFQFRTNFFSVSKKGTLLDFGIKCKTHEFLLFEDNDNSRSQLEGKKKLNNNSLITVEGKKN